jgi:hypothetical protein
MAETPRRPSLISPHSYQLVSLLLGFPLQLTVRAPSSSPTDLMTLHASSLSYFQQTAEVAKVSLRDILLHTADMQVLEVREGAEGLTEKAIKDRLLQN